MMSGTLSVVLVSIGLLLLVAVVTLDLLAQREREQLQAHEPQGWRERLREWQRQQVGS